MVHPYTLGCDVSTWQGEWEPSIAAAAGCEFVWVRAGSTNNVSGVTYTDNQFNNNIAAAPEHLKVGTYWYFRPNHDVTKQADYWCDLIFETVDEPWFLGVMPDVEFSGGLSQRLVQERTFQFIQEVQQNLRLRNDQIVGYTRASFWNIAVGTVSWMNNYPWCIARYRYISNEDIPDLTGPWSDNRFKVSGLNDWAYWQFSADGNLRGAKYGAQSGSIDLQYRREPFPEADDSEEEEAPIPVELVFPIGKIALTITER